MKRYDMSYGETVRSDDGQYVLYENYLIQQERAVAAEKKLVQIGQWIEQADIAKLLGIVFGSYQEG